MRILLSLIVLILSNDAFAAVEVSLKKRSGTAAVQVFDVKVASEQSFLLRQVTIVNYSEKNPKKFLWIFHGYKPGGDPYQQGASYFIQNWNLAALCKKNNIVCVIPDMGASMYLAGEVNNSEKVSDMRFLKELYNELIFSKYKDAPVVLAGLSTGAEGALKFATMIKNVESVIGISGTYDFFALPRESGEYKIHERIFGTDQAVWVRENPIEVLKHSMRTRLYLFCESNSMYKAQADIIVSIKMSNLDTVNLLHFGKGFGHNWTFWSSGKLVKELHRIISEK